MSGTTLALTADTFFKKKYMPPGAACAFYALSLLD